MQIFGAPGHRGFVSKISLIPRLGPLTLSDFVHAAIRGVRSLWRRTTNRQTFYSNFLFIFEGLVHFPEQI
jgi:hypothetical protein